MVELSWEFYARQFVSVLASAATVFLFLALLAFEWQRREAMRGCQEAAQQIRARNEEIKAERARRREERRRLAGLTDRRIAGVIKKMVKG